MITNEIVKKKTKSQKENLDSKVFIKPVIIKILIIFVFLTILNILLFTIMAFQNQADLIKENAILEAENTAINLRFEIDKKLKKTKVITKKYIEDLKELLSYYKLSDYTVFTQTGKIIDCKDKKRINKSATTNEKKQILSSITHRNFQNQIFKSDKISEFEKLPLYIPINYNLQKYYILKITINIENIKSNFQYFVNQTIVAGSIMVFLHLIFSLIAYKTIITPLRHANTKLDSKNIQLRNINRKLLHHNKRIEEELNLAKAVQEALLPTLNEKNKIYEYYAKYKSLEKVSGDFFDIIQITENKIGILMLDVSGHGVASALVTAMAKVAFNTNATKIDDISKIFFEINNELVTFLGESDYYLTAFLGILDFETQKLEYVNAGHSSPYIYRHKNGHIDTLEVTSFYVGAMEDIDFEAKITKLDENDILLIYTDGIIEAMNKESKLYSDERLYNVFIETASSIKKSSDNNYIKKIVDEIIKDLKIFKEGQKQNDDISIIAFKTKKVKT